MTKKNPVYLTVLLVALSIVLTFQITFLAVEGYKGEDNNAKNDSYESVISRDTLEKIKEIATQYASYYPGEIDSETVEKYLISAIIAGVGDDFGVYYDADSFNSRLEQIEGSYKGIGITATYDKDSGAITVKSVTSSSPAEQAGILAGDMITHIGSGDDRVAVADVGYEEAVSLIRGEAGSYVTLTLKRADSTLEVSVMRSDIINQSVTWRMLESDSRIALIRISQFEKATVAQFEKALADAKAKGALGYVFDVRSNPGGELGAVTKILDMLLPSGPIIRIEYKDEKKNSQIDSDDTFLDAPMTVLCNSSTASAGELFCAALKDYRAATVIGIKTFGKGTMQSLIRLSDGAGLAITIAYYLPPYSDNYHGVGVIPDVESKLPESLAGAAVEELTEKNDTQLQTALSVLRESLDK